MDTQLEIRQASFGLGLTTNNWPTTCHYIVKMGHRECRLIVPKNNNVSTKQIVVSLVYGLIVSFLQ